MSKKILYILAIAVIIAAAVILKKSEYGFSGFYLDTAVICQSVSGNSQLSEKSKSAVSEIEKEVSAYNCDSVIYRLNAGEKVPLDSQGNIPDILNGYKNFEQIFGKGVTPFCGSLTFLWDISSDSPRVPSRSETDAALKCIFNASEYDGNIPDGALIDLGAGAKGYVCDLLLEAAESDRSAEEMIFSAGSSSLMFSKRNRKFTVAVDDPFSDKYALKFTCGNTFISTAGGYERFFEDNGIKYTHIMDINTGYPARTDLESVTVILPCEKGNGLYSDLLSTLICIGGSEKASEYADICKDNFYDYGIILIGENGNITQYGGIFTVTEEEDV